MSSDNKASHGICKREIKCGNIVLHGSMGVMVYITTFNNISFISWRSALLVEETGTPEDNYQSAASN
jgi:hypothetical protein